MSRPPIKEKPNIFGMPTRTVEHTAVAEPSKKQLIDLRKILLDERGSEVVKKVIDIALDDEHSCQAAALKMCWDRLLPMSEFEKGGGSARPVVTINIGGLDDKPITIEGEKVGES